MQKERSIEDQVRNCMDFAHKKGWKVLENHIYADKAVSGASLAGRIQLARLLEIASTKPTPFDYILVDDTSRLSRDKIDQMNIIEDFHTAGVFLFFVSQNIDTADEQANDVVIPIHGIVDALYLKELAKKTKRGMTGQVLSGFNPGGMTYGYSYTKVPDPSGRKDKKTKEVRSLGTKITVNEDESQIVRKIFALYAAGVGLKEIAHSLNKDGIEPPRTDSQRGGYKVKPSWCPNAIRYMLRNPKYIGDWTWNKYKWFKNRRTGKRARRLRDKAEWVRSPRPDLRIIDDSTWQLVQNRIEANKHQKKSGRRPGSKYLLTGMLKCSVCGSNLISVHVGKSDVKFACSLNWHRGPSVCPNSHKIMKSELEGKLLGAVRDQILRPEMLDRLKIKIQNLA